MMKKNQTDFYAAIMFLLPNFLGFALFMLLPLALCFLMVFTNWSLKPAVDFSFIGLRNFIDLLGVRALSDGDPAVLAAYIACCLLVVASLVGLVWSAMAGWKGIRKGGIGLCLGGLATFILALHAGDAGQGVYITAVLELAGGLILILRPENEAGPLGPASGVAPALGFLAASLGLWLLQGPMWASYQPRDARFWEYLYNTLYLMMGIPVSMAGALALALLVNNEFPLKAARQKFIGTAGCVLGGVVTLFLLKAAGYPNLGVLGAIFWCLAALGVATNVVTYRTIFYLPTFTSGIALMILWKALFNPEFGPINASLAAFFHLDPAGLPHWLTSEKWAKAALIVMGVWTAIGGTGMLLYLSALTEIPGELLDAAKVDGANGWNRFLYVTWPHLAPTTFFILVTSIMGGLQGGFEQARVMTGGAFGTTTLSYYIYQKAFMDLDLGYAAAISWVVFALIFAATAMNWKLGKEFEV